MIQLRSEETGIINVETLQEALSRTEKDKTIWKISFSLGEERVRLVRLEDGNWTLRPLKF
jgi:hypothetical protein